MLHRMILAARSRIDLGDGPVQGDLGIFLAACMQTAVERELTGAMRCRPCSTHSWTTGGWTG